MGGIKPKVFRLSRDATERWHLLRTLATQLVQHERISTTYHKAKALEPLMHRVIKLAKQTQQKKPNSYNKLCGILTTRIAVKKMTQQIIPRLTSQGNSGVRVVSMDTKRKGDNARMGYIEFIGNEIEKYEEAVEKEKYLKGEKTDLKQFNKKILQEEKEFFQSKLEEQKKKLEMDRLQLEEQVEKGKLSQQQFEQNLKQNVWTLRFFEQKLETIEKDMWIETKNKYDLRKYYPIY